MKKMNSHQRSPHNWFIREGLSDRNQKNQHGWILKSFDTILEDQEDDTVITGLLVMQRISFEYCDNRPPKCVLWGAKPLGPCGHFYIRSLCV